MRTEIRIGGFGGQGVILAGIILGKAASIFDKNEAVHRTGNQKAGNGLGYLPSYRIFLRHRKGVQTLCRKG